MLGGGAWIRRNPAAIALRKASRDCGGAVRSGSRRTRGVVSNGWKCFSRSRWPLAPSAWRTLLSTRNRADSPPRLPQPGRQALRVLAESVGVVGCDLETLNILENFPLGQRFADPLPADPHGDRDWTVLSPNVLHVLAEAAKIAWQDRVDLVGDPAFVDVPFHQILSQGYANQRAKEITWNAKDYASTDDEAGTCTLSVIDRNDNAVALTFTLGGPFGSGVIAPGTGFFLNNQITGMGRELEDGSQDPAAGPDMAEAGKRTISSRTPTIVVRDGRPILAVGGTGGRTIIMGVLRTVVNVVDFGLDIAHSIDAPKVDPFAAKEFGCTPKQLFVEASNTTTQPLARSRIGMDTLQDLRGRGHDVCVINAKTDTAKTGGGADYGPFPRQRAAGYDLQGIHHVAASDPRSYDLRGFQELELQRPAMGAAGQGVPENAPWLFP